VDYICFKIPDESLDLINCIGILRGFACDSSSIQKGFSSLEAVLLCIPEGYHCVDLSLYKVTQISFLTFSAHNFVLFDAGFLCGNRKLSLFYC